MGVLSSLASRAKSAISRLTAAPSEIHQPQPLQDQLLRVGRQTPEQLTRICRQADDGYMWRLCDVLEEDRNQDCHLQTVLYRRENAPARVDWQIVPTSEKPRALRVAAFVERCLRRLGDRRIENLDLRDLSGTLVHLNSAVAHGYAEAEVLWHRDGRYVVPSGTLPIPARRFVFAQHDGSLRWWDASGSSVPYPGIDLRKAYPPGRILDHRPRINGAAGPREGLQRPLAWACLFRKWSLADWLKTGELTWKPYRWGEYTKGADQGDIAALDSALELLTTNGWARLPETAKFHAEFAKNSAGRAGGLHAELCAFLAAEMSKITLGATLTVEQGKTGAMALGNVHQDVSKEILELDTKELGATIRRQLIAPLVRMNFGSNVEVPEFVFLTQDAVDLQALAAALKVLLEQGLDVPAKWAREMFGIPEPLTGDELIGKEPRIDPSKPAASPPPADEPEQDGPAASTDEIEKMLNVYHLRRALAHPSVRQVRAMRLAA